MKFSALAAAICFILCGVSGCGGIRTAEEASQTVVPYAPVNEENVSADECRIELGDSINVNGQGAWYEDNDIVISKGGIYSISGSYDKGSIVVTAEDPVKLNFIGAEITNSGDYAIISSSKRLVLASDGETSITGEGGDYKNAVFSSGQLLIAGTGTMRFYGGVFSVGGIEFGRNINTVCDIITSENGQMIPGTLTVWG